MAYQASFDEYRTFGVEIECFGVPKWAVMSAFKVHEIPCVQVSQTNEVMDSWRLSHDGSIVGDHPIEMVSPPLSGQAGLAEVREVMDILYVLGCQVNVSCGFHVHWNCGDFTGKNVLSLLRLYAKFEKVIDYLVSPSRREDRNDQCQTMLKGPDLSWITDLDPSERKRAAEVALQFDRALSVRNPRYRLRRSSRYHKVNVSAYNLYGTIEFRQHQGTLQADKAINWTVLTQQFVNKAKQVAVSREPSAKLTLSELMRSLRITGSDDETIQRLEKWMRERYANFKRGEDQHEIDVPRNALMTTTLTRN